MHLFFNNNPKIVILKLYLNNNSKSLTAFNNNSKNFNKRLEDFQ